MVIIYLIFISNMWPKPTIIFEKILSSIGKTDKQIKWKWTNNVEFPPQI